jgi:hypothetical protein
MINVVAGMNKAHAQFFSRGRRLHLLLHTATLVRHLDDEFRHASRRQPDPGESLTCLAGFSRDFFSGLRLSVPARSACNG